MSGSLRVSARHKSAAHRNAEKAAEAARRRKAKFASAAKATAAIEPWAGAWPGGRARSPAVALGVRNLERPNAPLSLKMLALGGLAACVAAILVSPHLRPRVLSIALAKRETAVAAAAPAAVVRQAAGRWIAVDLAQPVTFSAYLTQPQTVAAYEVEDAVPASAGLPASAPVAPAEATAAPEAKPPALNVPQNDAPAASLSLPQVAAIDRKAAAARESGEQIAVSVPVPPVGEQASRAPDAAQETSCSADDGAPAHSAQLSGPSDFGRALAAAAMRQTRDLVIYTDKYRTLKFPMGDVPRLYGVCTDVVIRAYRALGVDLQARVQAARVGSRDVSIAHRRTFTLRRYFASRGASLAITDFAEDYWPGDVVTYFRPQNSGSRDHVAIVAEMTGPSGRPMIIHNRGWGPQIEDALFVDKITGHYRYGRAQDQLALLAMKAKTKGDSGAEEKHNVQIRRKAKAISAMLKARASSASAIKK